VLAIIRIYSEHKSLILKLGPVVVVDPLLWKTFRFIYYNLYTTCKMYLQCFVVIFCEFKETFSVLISKRAYKTQV